MLYIKDHRLGFASIPTCINRLSLKSLMNQFSFKAVRFTRCLAMKETEQVA